MASSDDEGEIVPKDVTEYEFKYDDEVPVSFSKLPIQWDGSGDHGGKRKPIFLSGKADNGILKIFKEVAAWKFELPRAGPEISVLSDGYWIKLLKPRKAFQDTIRTIQITLHFLHFAKWNPQQSEKALWDYLIKSFSMFEKRPCEDDVVNHMPLIYEAVKRDENLANSKLLSTYLEEKPRKRKNYNEDVNPPFIVDDVDGEEEPEEALRSDESDEDEPDEDDCFDSVCAICDNGGHILICEGKCMRSFHATVEDGEESNCESLGFDQADQEALKNTAFFCKNCQYNQHQCFACGELGCSDESSPEVFCCVNGACGYFYHPSCVAKLLHPDDKAAATERQKRIAAGEQFACPAHKCHKCQELEVRSDHDLQFAVCRRCPRAYHRKCLPRNIAFEEDVDEDGEIVQRAWVGLIPNRILIYCLKHEIDPDIATPARKHIKFPGSKIDLKKSVLLESSKKKDVIQTRGLVSEDNTDKRISSKPVVKVSSSSKQVGPRKITEKLPVLDSSKKAKVTANRNSFGKSKDSANDRGHVSLGDRLYAAFYGRESEPENSSKEETVHGGQEGIQRVKPTGSRINTSVTLDAASQKRILALMKDASSSVTLDQVRKKHKSPSTHSQHSKFYLENITSGKVEGAVQAVRAALKKLDDGGSLRDARAVCGDGLLSQVFKWSERFKVYLSPFLYGMRYTSFGRHFTKTNKLKEIVDILHWYFEDNDMLVDFCCGANEFSCLVKEKLDETGKKCSFKNYDILQAKNDFCFERRDWMGVRQDELPNGSQLIMGLNPPFGVNAALANKFINKALEFKPKLLVLIVPQETQRCDEKEFPYDLILEDDQMFGGKSFYLPGSVDVNDKQIEDWNVKPPVLYLWSRPDWTPKHKAIAEMHALKKENHIEMQAPESAPEIETLKDSVVPKGEDLCPGEVDTHEQKKGEVDLSPVQDEDHEERGKEDLCSVKAEAVEQKGKSNLLPVKPAILHDTKGKVEGSPPHDSTGGKGAKSTSNQEKKRTGGDSSRSGGKRKRRRHSKNDFPEGNNPQAKHSAAHLPPPNVFGRRGSVERYSPRLNDTPSQLHSQREREDYGYQPVEQMNFSPYQQHHPQNGGGGGYSGGNQEGGRMYSLKGEESFASATSRHAYGLNPRPDYSLRAASRPPPEGRVHSFPHHGGGYMGQVGAGYGTDNYMLQRGSGIHPQSHPAAHGFPPSGNIINQTRDSVYGRGMSNASTMQRYASRLGLEEMNHSPMGGGMVSRPPLQDASGTYRTPPGPRPVVHHHHHHHQVVGSFGFASAPPRGPPYPHQGSSGGWLPE